MTKDEIKSKIEEVFTFLYTECVSPSFRFPQGYGAAIVDKFIDSVLVRESGMVNLGFVVDYCIHQAHLWRDNEKWEKRFNISWAFGPKAIDRFYGAKRGLRYYEELWLKDYDLSRESLRAKFTNVKGVHPLRKYIYIEAEDTSKAKLLNKASGWWICQTLTTLYAPQSPVCNKCDFKERCENLLKKKQPELWRLRTEKNNNL